MNKRLSFLKKEVGVSERKENALDLVGQFSPREFGIKNAFYRDVDDSLDLVFIVEKQKAGSAISYLNSLVSLVKKEKRVPITSSVYIYSNQDSIENLVQKESLKELKLSSIPA